MDEEARQDPSNDVLDAIVSEEAIDEETSTPEGEPLPSEPADEPPATDEEETPAAEETEGTGVTPVEPVELSETEQQVIKHLLFHKALVDEADDGERINSYLQIAKERAAHVALPDPFDRAIALAFELVLENELDPWRIDLMQFSSLYLERVRDKHEIDLIAAGRLLLMAWTILRKQSEDLKQRAEPPPPPEPEPELDWGDIPMDWGEEDDGLVYTQSVIGAPEAPLDEKIRHKGDRKVTFMELLDALEEARVEAEFRREINEKRAAERALRREQRRNLRADGAAHKEDQEQDIAEVWQRITRFNGHPIPITDIQERTRDDLVKTLVSVLFLARQQRIRVWQEDFPFGMIYIQNPQNAHPAEGEDENAAPPEGEPADAAAQAHAQAAAQN